MKYTKYVAESSLNKNRHLSAKKVKGSFCDLLRLFVLVGLLVVSMAVCLNCVSTTKPMETEADFIGFITGVRPNGESGVLGQISVESHADKIVSKYVITIKDETLIFRQDGDNLRRVAFKTLENKQWVKIWFAGPVMESFPVQGTAGQVVIIE